MRSFALDFNGIFRLAPDAATIRDLLNWNVLLPAGCRSRPVPEFSHLTLRKLTTKGRLLWSKDFDFGDTYHIHQAKDGSVFLPSSKGLLMKLNKDGEGVWTNRFGNYLSDRFGTLSGLDTDSSGNVYVGGFVGGSVTNIGGTNVLLSPEIYVIAKFDSHGSVVWSNQIPKPFVHGAMSANPRGSVYLALDGAMIKFSPAGVPVWTNILDVSGIRLGTATHVVLDTHGDVHVTGWGLGVDCSTLFPRR